LQQTWIIKASPHHIFQFQVSYGGVRREHTSAEPLAGILLIVVTVVALSFEIEHFGVGRCRGLRRCVGGVGHDEEKAVVLESGYAVLLSLEELVGDVL